MQHRSGPRCLHPHSTMKSPIVGVFRRGGLHFGHHAALNLDLTAPNRDLTATKRKELCCERCTVELGPRRGRRQTGELHQ